MKKLVARPYSCEEDGCKSCFELERLNSDTARKSEETNLIVQCKDVETLEEWTKIITKEIGNPKILQYENIIKTDIVYVTFNIKTLSQSKIE